MSDHVALSIDQISQSEKRAESNAGNHAANDDFCTGSSGSNTPSSAYEDIVHISESVGLLRDRDVQTQEIYAHANHLAEAKKKDSDAEHKECSSCLTEALNDVNFVSEDEVPLLEGDRDKVDNSHVAVPIENELYCGKKSVLSPALAECRICQEEDDITNLESPCACSGSLKFAHRKCVQHWCNEKGDTRCEICQKPFEGGYVTPQQARADNAGLDLGARLEITIGQPRLFALAADHVFLDGDYDEHTGSHANSAACVRSIALVVILLLLLRHILSMAGLGADEDLTTFFLLPLMRTAGFLIPCYIMARAMNALQLRHQEQEAARAAAAEVTHLIQTGQIQAVRHEQIC